MTASLLAIDYKATMGIPVALVENDAVIVLERYFTIPKGLLSIIQGRSGWQSVGN